MAEINDSGLSKNTILNNNDQSFSNEETISFEKMTADDVPPTCDVNDVKNRDQSEVLMNAANMFTKNGNKKDSDSLKDNLDQGNMKEEHEPRIQKKISLKDLVQRSPLESEAETYILRTLDAVDPTTPGPSEAELSLLRDMPSTEIAGSKTGTSSAVKKSGNVTHRRIRSTADELFDLTQNLAKLQGKHYNEEHFLEENNREEDNNDTVSSADILAKNATTLLRRRNAQSYLDNKDQMEKLALNQGATKAKAKWNTVKATIIADRVKDNATNASPTTIETKANVIDEESGEALDESDHDACHPFRKEKKTLSRTVKVESSEVFQDFKNWLIYKKKGIITHVKLMLFLMIPATGVAAVLFYGFENPPCGTTAECQEKQAANSTGTSNPGDASYSWWILFVCVRNVFVFTLAAISEAIIVDFCCLRTRALLTVTGPVVTLYTVQSKGWPFKLTYWGIYAFAFLYGDYPFARHWLYWQDVIDLFNANNPSGNVTNFINYRNMLILAIVTGVLVSIKRLWVGLLLGRHTYSRYAADLADVMSKVLLIGKISELARDIHGYGYKLSNFNMDLRTVHQTIREGINDANADSQDSINSMMSRRKMIQVGQERVFGKCTKYGSSAALIDKLLGEWEPPKEIHRNDEHASIKSIIQFRNSLSCLNTNVPFGPAFGLCHTRHECIEASETLFRQLLLATPGKFELSFDVLALLAMNDNGDMDEEKIKQLIKVFRPERDGSLSLIDFVKSVDEVYKELRLLRASVLNSSRLDRAFEHILNIVFYFIGGCIALASFGIDPLVLFASVSGFILAFAFMIGPACSKFFEGLLFILVRRPYDIGDRINVSDVNRDTEPTGSPTWFVRDVTLFTTTVCFASSNEIATYSNGSLASSRIINAARSPNACVHFPMKFPIDDASYEKLQIFKGAVEEFVKARPREYLNFSAFRCQKVEADLGYVQYIVIVNHRESWQNLGSVLSSKAELQSFTLELTKKMNLRYHSPPMPVDLRMNSAAMNFLGIDSKDSEELAINEGSSNEMDIAAVNSMFKK